MAPNTSAAIARHQVQEAGVHAFDAQQAAGHALPLPAAVAADGVNEYITVELPTNGPWPYEPATVVLETGPGGNWVLDLGPHGVHVLEGDEHGDVKPTATVTADPSDMVLAFYRRDTAQRSPDRRRCRARAATHHLAEPRLSAARAELRRLPRRVRP